jgi:hypothetical protein
MAFIGKLRIAILLSVLSVLALHGCKNADKASQYTIGFSQCIGSDLWRRNMLDEMKMELSLHPVPTLYMPMPMATAKNRWSR